MKIGIIVAMNKELQQLQHLFTEDKVIVQKCGIGKVNAALGAQRMINDYHPDVIISSGCAGGNGDDIQIQDIIVGAEVCYHDVYCGTAIDNSTQYGQIQGLPARYQADPTLLQKAMLLKSAEGRGQSAEGRVQRAEFGGQSAERRVQSAESISNIHSGLIVTGDWFVDSKEKMRDIISHFPEAKAIDMESCAIAQTCYINRVPFISFRVISDIPLRDTNASQYHDFWNTVAENSFQVTRTFVESL